MLDHLNRLATGRRYWQALILLGLAQLALALFYQYVRDEPPCMLCIQVRVLLSGVILLGIVALFVRRQRWLRTGAHVLNTVLLGALVERSWILLGTERGTLIASCAFDLGLPPWLALDRWFPALYEIQTSCGYTPELLFGVTMAEALLVTFGVLLAVSVVLTAASLRKA